MVTTRPQPRRQAKWLDRFDRETRSASARSAGYAGPSRSANDSRHRVGSERAWPKRASTSAWEPTCNTRPIVHGLLNSSSAERSLNGNEGAAAGRAPEVTWVRYLTTVTVVPAPTVE